MEENILLPNLLCLNQLKEGEQLTVINNDRSISNYSTVLKSNTGEYIVSNLPNSLLGQCFYNIIVMAQNVACMDDNNRVTITDLVIAISDLNKSAELNGESMNKLITVCINGYDGLEVLNNSTAYIKSIESSVYKFPNDSVYMVMRSDMPTVIYFIVSDEE